MGFIARAIPVLSKAKDLFKSGMSIAKAVYCLCAIGVAATVTMIGQLTGLLDEEVAEGVVEPP